MVHLFKGKIDNLLKFKLTTKIYQMTLYDRKPSNALVTRILT